MSIESKQYGSQHWPELLFWTARFEWLKHNKVGIFMEKGNSQRLKKSEKFAFENSQYTRQHNILLSGTNKYRRIADKIVLHQTSDQSSAWRLQSWFQVWLGKKLGKVRWNNWQQFPWTKKVVSRTATLLFDNACILNLKQNTNDERNFYYVLVLLWGFVFKSGSDSTCLWWIGLQLMSI